MHRPYANTVPKISWLARSSTCLLSRKQLASNLERKLRAWQAYRDRDRRDLPGILMGFSVDATRSKVGGTENETGNVPRRKHVREFIGMNPIYAAIRCGLLRE